MGCPMVSNDSVGMKETRPKRLDGDKAAEWLFPANKLPHAPIPYRTENDTLSRKTLHALNFSVHLQYIE